MADSCFYYADDDEMFVGVRSVTTRDADGELLNCLEYDNSGRLSREYLYVSDSAVLMREIVRNNRIWQSAITQIIFTTYVI